MLTQASSHKEPIEVYRHMNSKGIGTKLAKYYQSWALATEDSGDTKAADKILALGVSNGAQPTASLAKFRESV